MIFTHIEWKVGSNNGNNNGNNRNKHDNNNSNNGNDIYTHMEWGVW